MSTIDLVGLDEAAVLAALYNAAKPQGMGFLQYSPEPMSFEQAQELLRLENSFDYVKGRVMKVTFRDGGFDPYLYNQNNGEGAAQRVIDSLRVTQDANSILIRSQHAAGTASAIEDVEEQLGDKSGLPEQQGEFVTYSLGLGDVADFLKPKIAEARRTNKSPLD